MYFLIKTIISGLIIAGASELGRRFTWAGAILVAMPLMSIITLSWLYIDTRSNDQILTMSYGIFWAVLPTLLFFLALPFFLRKELSFPVAMVGACIIMGAGYVVYAILMRKFGIAV